MINNNYNNQPLHLSNKNIIFCYGLDIKNFLQNQITNDIRLLTSKKILHALILSPKGKILTDLFIYNYKNGYFLEIHKSVKNWLLEYFNIYKLKSNINFKDLSKTHYVGVSNKPTVTSLSQGNDPRIFNLKHPYINRGIFDKKPLSRKFIEKIIEYKYATQSLANFGVDYYAYEFFPQDLWFDKLGSINYTKGCYIGQEVISSIHHKLNYHKRLVSFYSYNNLKKSDRIISNDKIIGKIISIYKKNSNKNLFLAVLYINKINKKNILTDKNKNILNIIELNWFKYK